MAITLSNGKTYTVKQPTLKGWRLILQSVPEEQFKRLANILIAVATDEAENDASVLERVLGSGSDFAGMMSDAVGLGAALASATLDAANSGDSVTVSEVEDTFTLEDIDDLITELTATGVIAKVWARLKNRMAGRK